MIDKRYSNGTAGKTLAKFLYSWKNGLYETMVGFSQATWRANTAEPSRYLKQWLGLKKPLFAKVVEEKSVTSSMETFTLVVTLKIGGEVREEKMTAILVKELGSYNPSEQGVWGVNPVSLVSSEIVGGSNYGS